MCLMNKVLKHFLCKFSFVYFDDILVFNLNLDLNIQHLILLFEKLREQQLFVNMPKCEFKASCVHFLGYIISTQGIGIDPNKVVAVQNWHVPTTLTEIRTFHSLANFYSRFF